MMTDQTKPMLDDIRNHLKAGGRAWMHLKRKYQKPNIGTHEIKAVDGDFLIVAVMEGWENILPDSKYAVPASSGGIDRIELEPVGGRQGSCRPWGSEAALHKIVADMERLAESEGEDIDAMARAAAKNVGVSNQLTDAELDSWTRDEMRDFP